MNKNAEKIISKARDKNEAISVSITAMDALFDRFRTYQDSSMNEDEVIALLEDLNDTLIAWKDTVDPGYFDQDADEDTKRA